MKTNTTDRMSDSEMQTQLTAGSGRITERSEESNAGTMAVLDKSAGVNGRLAGVWQASARGGWEKV